MCRLGLPGEAKDERHRARRKSRHHDGRHLRLEKRQGKSDPAIDAGRNLQGSPRPVWGHSGISRLGIHLTGGVEAKSARRPALSERFIYKSSQTPLSSSTAFEPHVSESGPIRLRSGQALGHPVYGVDESRILRTYPAQLRITEAHRAQLSSWASPMSSPSGPRM